MLAKAGRDGIVEASLPGLADASRVSIDECIAALECLSSPDKYSRTKEFEGRRIEAIDGGWRILNHAKYRSKMNADERREYFRLKKQEQRSLSKDVHKRPTLSNNVTNVTHAEAEAEAEADNKYILSGKPDEMEVYSAHARAALHWLNEKSGKKFRESEKSLAPINARLKEKGVDIEGVKKMIERQCQRWLGTSMAEYLRPETLFGKEKFDGYYAARELPVIADGKQNQQRIDRSIGTANEGKAANYRGIKFA